MSRTARLRTALRSVVLVVGAASAQEPRPLVVRSVDLPEDPRDVVWFDADGDGRADLLASARGGRLVARVRRADGSFDAPRSAAASRPAVALSRGTDGASVMLVVGDDGVAPLPWSAFAPHVAAAGDDATAPPPSLAYAEDFDGDGAGDVLAAAHEGFDVRLATGRAVPVRPPRVRRRVAEEGGLWVDATSYPAVAFRRLAPGAAPRPVWFADGAVRALAGDFTKGFGPEADVLTRFAEDGAPAERALERNEARLEDLDGDGTPEAILVRTRTAAGAVAGAKTEIVFRRLGASDPKPRQAILLPGVLSSGPDLRDLDGDGRPDLRVSAFGDDLKSQVARGLRGAVKLAYYVYRGTGGATPFERTPALVQEDDVPAAHFDVWALRHRLLVDVDWTGDGRPDLVRFRVEKDRTLIEVFAAVAGGGPAFAETPAFAATLPAAATEVRLWGPAVDEPAILARAAGRLFVVGPR